MSDQNKLSLRKPRTSLDELHIPQKFLDWKRQEIHICTIYSTAGPHIIHLNVTRKKILHTMVWIIPCTEYLKFLRKTTFIFESTYLMQKLHYVRTWCTLQRYIWDINFLWLMHKYFSKLTDFYHINDVINYNVFETLFFNFLSKNWYVSLKKFPDF